MKGKTNLRIIIGAGLSFGCSFGLLNLYTAGYSLLPDLFGVGVSVLSGATSIMTLLAFVLGMIAYKIIAKIKLRGSLLLCIGLLALYTLAMAGIGNFVGFTLAMVIQGTIVGICSQAVYNAILSNWFKERSPIFIGINLAACTLGMSIYQFVGGFMFDSLGFRKTMLICGIFTICITAFANVVLLRKTAPDGAVSAAEVVTTQNDINQSKKRKSGNMMKSKVFWLFVIGAVSDAASVIYCSMYITMVFTNAGIAFTVATTVLSLCTATAGIFTLFSGSILKKMGMKKYLVLIYGMAIVCNVCFIMFPKFHGVGMIAIIVTSYAIGYACGLVGNYLCRDLFKEENVFDANAKYVALASGGQIVLLPTFGRLIETVGFNSMYTIIIILVVVSLIVYLWAIQLVEKEGKI